FVSGETDLRGIFVADGIRGMAAAIARDENRRYAFHRGATFLARREEAKKSRRGLRGELARTQVHWSFNLAEANKDLQISNFGRLNELYKQQQKGVQVQQAM
ncbi:hypothetical protein HQ563_11455, partial [bacterium]|nr:hypothetical protein [bacterium]